VANQFSVFCCGGSREVGDPRIDPSNGVRNICTINRDLIANEEILCHIGLDPLTVIFLLFNRPSTIPYPPNLGRGFLYDLFPEGSKRERKGKKDGEKDHTPI
jgi:hypothetical protein